MSKTGNNKLTFLVIFKLTFLVKIILTILFGVPYAVIQEALTREDVMKHGRNACAD